MAKTKKQDAITPQMEQIDDTPPVVDAPAEKPLDNDIDDIASELSGQTPEVNQGVIQAEAEKTAFEAGQQVRTDNAQPKPRADKVVFDPSIHEVDDFGQPVLTPA